MAGRSSAVPALCVTALLSQQCVGYLPLGRACVECQLLDLTNSHSRPPSAYPRSGPRERRGTNPVANVPISSQGHSESRSEWVDLKGLRLNLPPTAAVRARSVLPWRPAGASDRRPRHGACLLPFTHRRAASAVFRGRCARLPLACFSPAAGPRRGWAWDRPPAS